MVAIFAGGAAIGVATSSSTLSTTTITQPVEVKGDPNVCRITDDVVRVNLSAEKYPAIEKHWQDAISAGYPSVLTLNRSGAAERRIKLLRGVKTAPGMDRDEYPMADARTDEHADVRLVPSAQNRGSGAAQAVQLRGYCSGQKFTIIWR